jgi:hypothetical protein
VLSPADYVLWVAGVLLDAVAVVCALKSKSFLRYLALSLYLLAAAGLSVARFVLLRTDGFNSPQYYYFYFFSDALLTIFLYFVLMGLYAHVFRELKVGKYVRAGAMLLLAGTALVSYRMVVASGDRMLGHFVAELSQNLYFVGLVLTYILWGAVMKLRETRTRLIQFVLSLGVYFSAFAATYALANLYTRIVIWQYVPPILGICLPAAWAYTFLVVSDEDRLAVASVAVSHPMASR